MLVAFVRFSSLTRFPFSVYPEGERAGGSWLVDGRAFGGCPIKNDHIAKESTEAPQKSSEKRFFKEN